MFVPWEYLTDILTRHSVVNSFMETFERTANDEKITLCMQNDLIRLVHTTYYFVVSVSKQVHSHFVLIILW